LKNQTRLNELDIHVEKNRFSYLKAKKLGYKYVGMGMFVNENGQSAFSTRNGTRLQILKEKYDVKKGKEDELGALLSRRFVGKQSRGHDFEDLMVNYFEDKFKQTNIGNKQSPFSDLKIDNVYYSVKYSGAKDWNTMLGNLFKGDYPWLISSTLLKTPASKELRKIESIKELEKFVRGNRNDNSYSVLWGKTTENDDEVILDLQISKPIKTVTILTRVLKALRADWSRYKKPIRGGLKDIFQTTITKSIKLRNEDKVIEKHKDTIEKDLIDKAFADAETMQKQYRKVGVELAKDLQN